jgi:lysophospholipase L1-like esterase
MGVVLTSEAFMLLGRSGGRLLDHRVTRRGTFGTDRHGPPIALGVMGDSLAVGYGARSPASAPAALIAAGLVEASDRPVSLTNVAEVGAESAALLTQLTKLRERTAPDVVLVMIGGNDVMHMKRLTDALWPLAATVRTLRAGGAEVVVATCPDFGTVREFAQPLRVVAHWYSRLLATGQALVVLRAGGRAVSLADTLGPLFRVHRGLFCTYDRVHPSSAGYAAAASVMLPSVRAAAGCPFPADERVPHRVYRKGSRYRLAWWAFRAVRRAGQRLIAYERALAAAPAL